MTLGIIMPLANEEETIIHLCEELEKSIKQINIKTTVYFILDNVSKDSTLELLNHYSKNNDAFQVVWCPQNKNVVDAYINGYKYAFKNNHDYLLEMDGGFSHNPSELNRFTEKLLEGYDCVYGSRFIKGGGIMNSNPKRLFYSKFGTIISNFLLGVKNTDATSGYQGFNKKTIEKIINYPLLSEGHFYQTEIKTLLRKHNWVEVPILYKNPSNSVSSKVLINSLKCLVYYIFVRKSL